MGFKNKNQNPFDHLFKHFFFQYLIQIAQSLFFVNRGEGLLRILVSVVVGVCDFFANIHQTLKVR